MSADAGRSAPTLEMVAALAGVSRATVSRVVNGAQSVAPHLAESVEEAVRALNYVPNRAARTLASRRTHTVTLLVPESTSKVFADPFFATVVEGVARYLNTTEYVLNIVTSSESDPDKTRRYLMGGNVDGVLVVSHHSGDHSWARLARSLPVVFAGRPLVDAEDSYFVEVDNEEGATAATARLVEGGRRHIATIAGPQDMPPGVDRLAGWRAALASGGLNDALVEVGDFTVASGAAAMRRLLDRGKPIDGIFAANDQMAAGAYSVIKERGLRIPEDIAVVGFDDDYYATTVSPALTTIHHPISALGEKMAELLVELIEGRPAARVYRLPTSLVVRDSA
ncbi:MULTISPECIES: LacI family DNA-binding transcriptional regulator [unclassified Arthrobacter]|uniref:LacI family DNA-binding transcriptional regulator n=1 Tax=unclassified Arthrobacter TaxID=235627 RepID=UPI001E46C9CC|nr:MULTISPECIES: LacI family DNA-binding transcriptional regulator [unclassified Arthrobacter]MCC9145337.1 LacI family transcriptional regulator [Arthrobacter sp. zg-Y919]MDK1276565.1 LacI family DNA-binding transcriptional regulator [Arthrobacter sp. zg.Y919]WIB01844.1 LacI family DNA-binding transcriptional regulator [Arthrobacter sp. zg-Y919]